MTNALEHLATALGEARSPRLLRSDVRGQTVEIPTPFPSPEDWRDVPIYFLLVDRFNNPASPPRALPWDGDHGGFQGGTLEGVRQRLDYLQELGVGALWLSPVLKNCQYDPGSYHGYGVQDFLAVDPRLSSDPGRARRDPAFVEGELRRLVDETHARGMYVIFDIVLNHTGDVFEYEGVGSIAPWRDDRYQVRWRDVDGQGRPEWADPPSNPPPDAAVWPPELRRNALFRQQGNAFSRTSDVEAGGDFFSLKELVTNHRDEDGSRPVWRSLIAAYQYLIARYDVDGFRIDTLKFVEPEFARVFGNAVREFALSVGKKNFFTFGEVFDNEDKIAHFVGRRATDVGDLVGVDAALDFPLFYRLPGMAKGLVPPSEVAGVFEYRKQVQKEIVSSHGEASRFFVTFLDNHDMHRRFHHVDPANAGRFDDQMTLGLACLAAMQGIPCLYYGTEQGLHGEGHRPEAVREALWGKADAFDGSHPFARAWRELVRVRRSQPALRYGRQYFRPISGDGVHFGISPFAGGVLAFSRILNDTEVLIVANTNTSQDWTGEVIVDRELNPEGAKFAVAFSNKAVAPGAGVVTEKLGGNVRVEEVNGTVTHGPLRTLPVALLPMEVQILERS